MSEEKIDVEGLEKLESAPKRWRQAHSKSFSIFHSFSMFVLPENAQLSWFT